MSRLGLTGRLILFIAIGMLLTQALALAVYLNDRRALLPGRQLFPTADQTEATVILFDQAGPEERDLLVRALSGSGMILRHGADLDAGSADRHLLSRMTQKLRQYSDFLAARDVRLTVPDNPYIGWFPKLRASISPSRIQLLVQLTDGSWLIVDRRPMPGLSLAGLPFGMVSAILSTLLAAVAMLVVWRETRPLRQLAKAAEAFGRDLEPQPLRVPRAPDLRALVLAFDDMQHRIARADRNRADMLAALSHDIRTPLTRLTLRLRHLDPALQEDAARDISQITRVADAAFQFTQAGGPNLDARIDLRALVADLAGEAGLCFVDPRPDLPAQVSGNGELLGRAVANLIDNAVKYGCSARIILTPGRDHHTIAVEDDGPGIRAGDRDRLLQPFQRGDIARADAIGGLGLGLALAHRIVERHGGTLSLSDTASGGLRAVLTVPSV